MNTNGGLPPVEPGQACLHRDDATYNPTIGVDGKCWSCLEQILSPLVKKPSSSTPPPLLYPRHGAVISDNSRYRFVLTRMNHDELVFGDRTNHDRQLPFIMHNGSTADALEDDRTIGKCNGFASRLGYGGIVVGNLYGYRSRHPKLLFKVDDPVGDIVFWNGRVTNNDEWIAAIFAAQPTGGTVIAAWGALEGPGKIERVKKIVRMADDAGVALKCLKLSAEGEPCHPLYLSYEMQPIPYRPSL